jgi:hypothetical protein
MKLQIIEQGSIQTDSIVIRNMIETNKFVVFKNYLDKKIISNTLSKIIKVSEKLQDEASKSRRKNNLEHFRKINLGDYGDFGEFPRFFRTIYVPYWNENLNFASVIFEPLIKLRNYITDQETNLGLVPDYERKLWSGCRIQQYFQGGGFFSEHRDIIVEKISKEASIPTIQLIALLTTKGLDYEQGGATIRMDDGELVNIEDFAQSGDVIAYDSKSIHGVLPIDPHKVLDLNLNTGRIVAIASIYNLL